MSDVGFDKSKSTLISSNGSICASIKTPGCPAPIVHALERRRATNIQESILYVSSFKCFGLQAASSKFSSPRLRRPRFQTTGPKLLASGPKLQAPGLGAQAFSHRFHAAGPVSHTPNSRLRVRSPKSHPVPQILSSNIQNPGQNPSQVPSRMFHAPDSSPAPRKPRPHASGIQLHKPQVPAPDQSLKL